ncbi:MAG: dTDP-D-glucose 4,6-dehydratase-like protein [Parcubacteria group bacterium Gr01-1014_29]|nr:MAG: dTDP-D-glucose 4,6-dehydratase-like protein [Parcubacteria group bacterium Gr01-1014_29]
MKNQSHIVTEDIATIVAGIRSHADLFEGATILISGGAGFLGTYFLDMFRLLNKEVLKTPCRVISIDNYITGSREDASEDSLGVTAIDSDIRTMPCIEGPVDYIIHAAGLASPFYYKKYPLETVDAAVIGARNLLELAREKKPKSFLFFSSSEIYGDPDPHYVPTPETYRGNVSSVGPRACYDESKRLTETLCMIYHERYGVPIKIVRPFNVYGPRMKVDDYRVMPMFIMSGRKSKILPVHGSGAQTRTFCYITDAIVGFLKVLLAGKNGEIYNIGNPAGEIGMKALAGLTAELLGGVVMVQCINYPDSYPPDEPQRRCPDITKARMHLGYEPDVDLKTGLLRTILWHKEVFADEEL